MNFYFDESFHDRKVTSKKGNVNIHRKDASDTYVAVFIGGNNVVCSHIENKYLSFEERQKRVYGLSSEQELKATIISKKNFNYGLSSFNKQAFEFYRDYFSILEEDVYIQINIISKVAQVIKAVFRDTKLSRITNTTTEFLYSVTKSLNNYRFSSVLIKIFNERGKFNSRKLVDDFIRNFELVVTSSSTSDKKRLERAALLQLIYIFNEVKMDLNTSSEYLFDYKHIFEGFDLFIENHSLSYEQIELYIDNEANTFEAATSRQKYGSVKICDSEQYSGIRLSDILSNFLGRMIKALSEDMQEPSINRKEDAESYDFKTKKLLSTEWFKLNADQFNLYKSINKALFTDKTDVYTSYYFDYALLVRGLLNYFDEYETYEMYQKYSSGEHVEYFNTYSCHLMADEFKLLPTYNQ